MFSLGDELCGGFFYEVAFFNLVLSVGLCRVPDGPPLDPPHPTVGWWVAPPHNENAESLSNWLPALPFDF